jgi:hypothetical protein
MRSILILDHEKTAGGLKNLKEKWCSSHAAATAVFSNFTK